MRVLFLAPQPFFQERGTPIAVRLALEVLARRAKDTVDLLVYHEGHDVSIPGVTIRRIKVPKVLSGIGPGISLKKLCCDVIFACTALAMVWRARRRPYELVHAVEESVFIAWLIRRVWGIPYLYDMDSSLAMQLTEKWWLLRPLAPIFSWFERRAVRDSVSVVPVCDALATVAARHGASSLTVLSDISFLHHDVRGEVLPGDAPVNLREEMEVDPGAFVYLYIGNLERYQGIDLLLESFALLAQRHSELHLAVIGGSPTHIAGYQEKTAALGILPRVHLLGRRPISHLNAYLSQANALVSPRTKGNNTPMKIYSYLHSGVPVVATKLPTHTQVMDDDTSFLGDATVEGYAAALARAYEDPEAARVVGARARTLAESRYTFSQFEQTLNQIYDAVEAQVGK